MSAKNSTIDADEISHFAKDSGQWWDEHGPFAPIHRINPARIDYLKRLICEHYGRDFKSISALQSLSVLDVGCGGGLVCEPMARLGAEVTGIDADGNAIAVAADHAQRNALDIRYVFGSAEELDRQFDVVLALEIVEHVADVDQFVDSVVDCCKPGGLIVFSTLNKTLKSLMMAKVAAEYILRWVPAGTHDWQKFMRPAALAAALRRAGVKPVGTMGLVFNPLKNEFALSERDLDVNYFMAAIKD